MHLAEIIYESTIPRILEHGEEPDSVELDRYYNGPFPMRFTVHSHGNLVII